MRYYCNVTATDMAQMRSRLSFENWTNKEIDDFLVENRFIAWRKLETGEVIGILELMFTTSVCMDVTPITPYAYRWCFEDRHEAVAFFEMAKEFDEVPKHRASLKGHRYQNKPLLVENDERGFPKW